MPKDEFDFEDPLELNGVVFPADEDTSAEMAECFAEEFLRLGYNHKQVLALFGNPHYLGPNLVLQTKGEPFVRDIVTETFARWGRPIQSNPGSSRGHEAQSSPAVPAMIGEQSLLRSAATGEPDERLTDPPLGSPAPKMNL